MASPEKGPVATEASHVALPGPPTPAFSPDPSALSAIIDPEIGPSAPESTRSTKRPRSPSLDPPASTADLSEIELSPKKVARLASNPRFSRPAGDLTARADDDDGGGDDDIDDGHQRVEQDHAQGGGAPALQPDSADDYAAQTALSVLRGAEALMSQKATPGAAATEVVAEAAAAVAAAVSGKSAGAESADMTDAQTISDATTALAKAAVEGLAIGEGGVGVGRGHDPENMTVDAQQSRSDALYPGPNMPSSTDTIDAHAMGGAMAYAGLAPKSPSSKKHKCPYCDTEFTRHHNLKSHLLTHSQEKPYSCQGCEMRFRRLHDLKRHSKLHTGEKPHICPRCDRKFARGDALARHTKGKGGCAGRRSSSNGNFVGAAADESFDASSIADADSSVMTGIEYDNADDDERRRLSLPAANKLPRGRGPRASTDAFSAHARSYPTIPDGQRGPAAAGLYPPSIDRTPPGASSTPSMTNGALTAAGSGHTPSTSISSVPISAGSASLFSQHGIAESPKPLSPAAGPDANAHQSSGVQSQATFAQGQFVVRRPSLAESHGLSSADSLQQARAGTGSINGDTNANIFSSEQGMWTYIQTLESRLKMQDERLKQQDERIALLEASKLGYEVQISNLKKGVVDSRIKSTSVEAQAQPMGPPIEPPMEASMEASMELPIGQQTEQHQIGQEEQHADQQADQQTEQQDEQQAERQAERHAEQQLEQHIGQQLENAIVQH